MSEVACLIPSVDSFADCWPATRACFHKYWPDCPWKIFTASNKIPFSLGFTADKGCQIMVGDDRGWVENLKAALDAITGPSVINRTPPEFVVLFLEDMLIDKPVDTGMCIGAQMLIRNGDSIGAVRLGRGGELKELPIPSGKAWWDRVKPDSPYRVSTSPTLWRISYLRKILANCGTTAWDFETRGTALSRTLPEEIWVQSCDEGERAIQTYYTAITRGKWDRNAVEWLKRDLGIEVDVSRGFMEAR